MAEERREAVDTSAPASQEAATPNTKGETPAGLDDDLVRRLRDLYDPMLEEPVPDEFVEILKRGRRSPE